MNSLRTSAPLNTATRVFHTLDALRGVAALGVVAFHLRVFFRPIEVPGGYLAVDLFFMMSGVVLARAYDERFRAGMGTGAFMRLRLIRLYPLYFFGTLLGAFVMLASLRGNNLMQWDTPRWVAAVAAALLFVPDFFSSPARQLFPLDIPCWSLFLEIVVNCLFAMTWSALTPRRLTVFCAVSAVGVALASFWYGNLDLGAEPATFFAGLLRTLFGFSAGLVIARHRVSVRPRISDGGFLAIIVAVMIVIAARPQGHLRMLWDAVCVLGVLPAIVYWGTRVDPSRQLQKLATFLGVTSYAVYVLHSPLSAILNSAMQHMPPSGGWVSGVTLGVTIVSILLFGSWLVDRYYDVPVRRRLTR